MRALLVRLLQFILCFRRPIAGLALLSAGIYLALDFFGAKNPSNQMARWLEKNGDAELLRLYQQTEDAGDRKALGIAFRTYEKRYGKGAWISHFNEDNPLGAKTCYADIASLALGLSDVSARDEFLRSHADSYDACIQAGLIEEARRYASLLGEMRAKGGKTWRIVAGNPFSVCVYDQLKGDQELWEWYVENRDWCDRFLQTFAPGEDAGLADGVRELRSGEKIYKAFAKEVDSLSDDEVRELADDDTEAEACEAVYASGMVFVQKYGDMLKPLVARKVPLIESMAVIANNHDAFSLDSSDEMHRAGEELARLYSHHRILWDNAALDSGAHVVWLSQRVPVEWAEQVVGAFGRAHVATFLHDKYWNLDGRDDKLLAAATETLYKCQDPGWACLRKYESVAAFKEFLVNPRIGFRAIPYILKFGEEKAFAEMGKDSRWVDECFDKDGKLKRQDVSWYEMSPVGGDLATVLKKYCQGRPCSMEEIGWAAFDTADMVMMAFTFGMSKVATTSAKTGAKMAAKKSGKMAAKRIGRQTTKKLLTAQTRRIEQGALKKTIGKGASRKGWSVFKRTASMFKKAGQATAKGAKNAGKSIGKGWRALKGVPPETWRRAYQASKAVMWLRWAGHTVPAKGHDFAVGVAEEIGEALGKMIHVAVAGAGDCLKAAVNEALGGGSGNSLVGKVAHGGAILLLIVLSVKLLLPKRHSVALVKHE